jgi:monovalent cation:H+ antiporter-2, CPA2 family
MPHDATLISTIAISFALAFALGYVAVRLSLQPLVGYLLAGIVIGSVMPAAGTDTAIAGQLAEIGVILLMFGVGLHFSLADLLAVRRIAVPGAFVQIGIATALGTALMVAWGWPLGGGIVLGLALSVASTVVLLKAMEERNQVSTPNGRIVIGWLIVEDLAMVIVLVLLPAFAEVLGGSAALGGHAVSDRPLLLTLAITIGKVAAFVALALIAGPRVMPWVLKQVARTGSRELFTLAVLAIALGIAFGATKVFDVSFALGAFFAGMVLNESDLSHKAAVNSMPFQDAFSVLFFVSVGMQFDAAILLQEPWLLVAVLLLVLVGKSLAAIGIVLVMGYPASTAILAAASLAQVGEFSFILGALGISYGLMPIAGLHLILAASVISISLNPFTFAIADRLTAWVTSRPRLGQRLEELRRARFAVLAGEMETARKAAKARAAARATFTPESLVERFPLFANLTPEQRELLVLHFQTQEAKPGERVIRAGEKADRVYFLASGEVEVAAPGKKVRLKSGAYFGEMALISGQPRSADVTALDFSKFSTLSQRDFRMFLRKFPAMRDEISALAAQRGQMNQQFLDSLAGPASGDAARSPSDAANAGEPAPPRPGPTEPPPT